MPSEEFYSRSLAHHAFSMALAHLDEVGKAIRQSALPFTWSRLCSGHQVSTELLVLLSI